MLIIRRSKLHYTPIVKQKFCASSCLITEIKKVCVGGMIAQKAVGSNLSDL